jgi:L-histidine N-alpha-methyltransferase
MTTAPLPRTPGFVQVGAPVGRDPVLALIAGLRSDPPQIEPRWFYDALGSRLFEAICELPEYGLTRAEAALFARESAALAAAIGPAPTLIDLGAGNCEKAAALFDLLRPAQYVALDVSAAFLRERLHCIQERFPQLPMLGVAQDFAEQLVLPAEVSPVRRLFFYPGSSIGNFAPPAAQAFLARIRAHCVSDSGADGALLIGVDLVKDPAQLHAAYNDALGVTAAFNRNVLLHVNRVAGTDFRVEDFAHVAFFNVAQSRIEMHLEALRDVQVRLPDGPLRLAAGQRVHTENSYKYTPESFEALLRESGFAQVRTWADTQAGFALCLARS